jgi:two-component system sensor histidine kinase KdpD
MDDSNNLSERAQKLLMAMIESTAMAMDRFRTAEERIHYREESEQERYRGNLLRAISHDLRTPLSGIMGTSEMIMDMSQKADPRYELADGIWKDADWLHSLVENILNLTRLEDGRLALQKQLEAVEEIIGSAIAHVAKRAPEYEINVNIPDELILVPMDAKLIVQVLVNLLDNAIKHTSPKRSISVNVEKNDTFAVFCVSDSGEGIAKDDLPNIFKMFYTSKNNAADAKRGVGLGLPICDAIVKAHGGTISAHNNTDGGAEFKFTLPLEVKKHE